MAHVADIEQHINMTQGGTRRRKAPKKAGASAAPAVKRKRRKLTQTPDTACYVYKMVGMRVRFGNES